MPNSDKSSIKIGEKLAKDALDKAAAKLSTRARALKSPGNILLEGDSWFNYPADDIPFILEVDYGYRVETVARRGDTLKAMAFESPQIEAFTKRLKRMASDGFPPKAILLSAGGNDVAGREFGAFLNHINSGKPILNDAVYKAFLSERIKPAYVSWFSAVNEICKQVLGAKRPILIHGYDFAVPDGRGYNIGVNISGPWMKPGFLANGRVNQEANKSAITTMISELNDLLAMVPRVPSLENVIHLDLRGSLPNGKDYKKWWANELHPTDEGFAIVAAKYHAVLAKL